MKHAACAALRFGQERPQCDQLALRRFVGDGGAAVGPLKGSATYNKQLRLRFVGRDAAIVVSESAILFAGDTEVPDTGKVNATWVFEKREGQWLIAAYHNCPVLAPAQ